MKYLKGPIFFFIVILFLELSFCAIMKISFGQNILSISLFSTILSSLLSLIAFHGKEKYKTTKTILILFILGVLFSVQCIFFHVFKVYFSVANLRLTDQAVAFYDEAIRFIIENLIYILIFMSPIPIYSFLRRKMEIPTHDLKSFFIHLGIIIFMIPTFSFYINLQTGQNNLYDLYHNINQVSLNIKKLGVLNAYTLDLYRTIFGFQGKIEMVSLEEEITPTEIEYEPNTLDINFDRETSNETIKTLNNYFKNDTGTLKNEYTGMFEGYNLVYITAESFSEIAISKEKTPTLYKMTHSGFVFENFYTPNVLSTIGGEFQSLTGLYPDMSTLSTWREGTNYFPYGLGNIFQKEGYSTYAYHNNSYVFQDRNVYLASQGFNNFKACYNGLENIINCNIWPQSDIEMFEKTSDDYIYNSNPFMAYYMTVSGHFAYTFDDNYIAYKNMDLVQDMNLSEEAEGYVATQIELDKALEILIEKLRKANKLDKTVFVLMADHYPYELDIDYINELSKYDRDETFEINHNALIIWNNKLDTITIDKACISMDVLPTIYNLFGIDYDSRLLMGKDILSTSPGVAIMVDHSWVTKKGFYTSFTGNFNAREEVNDTYIQNVNSLVNTRLNISRMIMETNYYKYLFQ